MGRECGVSQKYRIATPTGDRVPLAVYQKLAFKQQNFEDGYFNFKLENGGEEIRVSCSIHMLRLVMYCFYLRFLSE